MKSSDHGDTWQVVPNTAEADYHELEIFGDQLITRQRRVAGHPGQP